MKKHDLKMWMPFFMDVVNGYKKFEIRKNDRDYKLGDILNLQEYDQENYIYTGNSIEVKVTYILHGGQFGIEEGYSLMSIE